MAATGSRTKAARETDGGQARWRRARRDHPRAPTLKRDEEQEVQRRAAVSASVVHEAIREEGEDELRRPSAALVWSGLAAGLSMGFSLVTEGLLRAALPETDWRPLVAKLGYSVGFLIVVLGRQQLFTENTLTVILPLLTRRDGQTLRQVARLWAVVLAANLAGALAFAFALAHTPAFEPDVHRAFQEIGLEALRGGFQAQLVRGIFAGWLIALMVWLLPFAEAARVFVIIILTWLVGIGGFTHIVAGAAEVFYMAAAGGPSWAPVVAGYLLPTLIGNIVGGVSLVAVINHAQVVAGEREAQDI
jgi:formate/nitrite transporter FocA (FNT family)